jgi:hypothetical protein
MTTTTTRTRGTAAGLMTGGLLLFPLTACTDATVGEESEQAISSATEEALEDTSTEGVNPSAPEVDCSGTSCELTLQSGQEAEVLGTTLAFTSVDGGEATIRVDGNEATCSEGEDVSAGPLSLECSTVSDDSVTLTASLG